MTYTEGKTEEEWIEKMFIMPPICQYISFEEFKTKGYFVAPLPEAYKPTPALRWFYEGRDGDTPEVESQRKPGKRKNWALIAARLNLSLPELKKPFAG